MTLLEVHGLAVKYRTNAGVLTAIRGIDLEVEPGEIVGIVGESGCGKSTVASAILRLLPPNGFISSGEVIFKGQDLARISAEQLRRMRGSEISMIFQDPMTSLNPVFNIEAQMMGVLSSHNGYQNQEEARNRAISMLDRVGIPDSDERILNYPHQFSGGMRQRILIAMALLSNPGLLIADEPTSALDVTLEAQILELIRGLRDELGTAILYISHDLGVIAQLCDRVIIMYAGNIVEQGDTFTIFERPNHPYTRALLAAYPSHRQRRGRLASIPGTVPSLKNLPAGCKFADRCSVSIPVCSSKEPCKVSTGAGHSVFCHLYDSDLESITEPRTIQSEDLGADRARQQIDFEPSSQVLIEVNGLRTVFVDKVGFLNQLIGRKPSVVRAVDGIDLNIRKGETIGLVGESGSGKTSLGKTLLRLVKASQGQILFDEQDITHLKERNVRPLRTRMQMIYQDPYSSLSPRMKVSSLLIEPFHIQSMPVDSKSKVPELLKMVGLSAEQADKYPHELSGGQARRVGIARALALSPDFLVADEPTSGLDVSVAASILNLLKDLREELGLTYLIITHNLNVINFISNRVGVMYLGKLVELGPTDSIYRQPAHPYTEALMAAISEPDPSQRVTKTQRPLVKGEIPSPKNPPPGCSFHPRCRYAEARCNQEQPELALVGEEHFTACFFPERVKHRLQS